MKNKVLIILSLFFSIIFLGLFILINSAGNINIKDTIEITATLKSVEFNEQNNGISIFTNEYKNSFYVSNNISNKLNKNSFTNLAKNEKLYIGIEKTKEAQINTVDFVSAVAVKTNNKTFLSLNDYNKYTANATMPIKVISLSICLLCIIAFILLKFKK